MRIVAAVVVSVALFGASCSDGGDSASTSVVTTSTTTATSTSTTASSTTTSSVAPSTTATTTSTTTTTVGSTVAPGTTVVCEPRGSQDEVAVNFPNQLSSLVGVEIRTGAHDCYERIVLELAQGPAPTPSDFPGYWVRYGANPVALGQTDDQFVTIEGGAVLLVTVASWMYETDASGDPVDYAGALDLFPTNVRTINELRMIDNSEGVHTWAIGLDTRRNLVVDTLTSPDRLVIDVML
jgi:hypothetical protein